MCIVPSSKGESHPKRAFLQSASLTGKLAAAEAGPASPQGSWKSIGCRNIPGITAVVARVWSHPREAHPQILSGVHSTI